MNKDVKLKKEIKNVLGGQCACYVLIRCSEPNQDGNMQVEMDYEGDECLAAYLIENAAQVFDDLKIRRESK